MRQSPRLRSRPNGRHRSGVQVGSVNGYGASSASGGLGCVNQGTPSVFGTAGVPGCGTATIPGTECGFKILWRKVDVEAGGTADLEILAGRAGTYKPRYWYGFGVETDNLDTNHRFEITDIQVAGKAQLIFNGQGIGSPDRGLSDFINRQDFPMPNDFDFFGSSPGQGITISLFNPHDVGITVYICFWGDGADTITQ